MKKIIVTLSLLTLLLLVGCSNKRSDIKWECFEYKTVEKMEIKYHIERHEDNCLQICSSFGCEVVGCKIKNYIEPYIYKWNESICVKEHLIKEN